MRNRPIDAVVAAAAVPAVAPTNVALTCPCGAPATPPPLQKKVDLPVKQVDPGPPKRVVRQAAAKRLRAAPDEGRRGSPASAGVYYEPWSPAPGFVRGGIGIGIGGFGGGYGRGGGRWRSFTRLVSAVCSTVAGARALWPCVLEMPAADGRSGIGIFTAMA